MLIESSIKETFPFRYGFARDFKRNSFFAGFFELGIKIISGNLLF